MAKYVLQVKYHFGPFGATNKAPQDGEIADRNSLKDIATQQVQVAGARWEIIKIYFKQFNISEWHNNIYVFSSTVEPLKEKYNASIRKQYRCKSFKL
jgi:hypothetical protein